MKPMPEIKVYPAGTAPPSRPPGPPHGMMFRSSPLNWEQETWELVNECAGPGGSWLFYYRNALPAEDRGKDTPPFLVMVEFSPSTFADYYPDRERRYVANPWSVGATERCAAPHCGDKIKDSHCWQEFGTQGEPPTVRVEDVRALAATWNAGNRDAVSAACRDLARVRYYHLTCCNAAGEPQPAGP